MLMLLEGAPGKIRKGSVEPLVASRTKKLASFPATSQVWGRKARRAVLLQAQRRGVAALNVNVHDRSRGAQTQSSAIVHIERMAGGSRLKRKWRSASVDVVDGKFPPTQAVILTDIPPLDLYEVWTMRVHETNREAVEVDICIAARLLESRPFGHGYVGVFSVEVTL